MVLTRADETPQVKALLLYFILPYDYILLIKKCQELFQTFIN